MLAFTVQIFLGIPCNTENMLTSPIFVFRYFAFHSRIDQSKNEKSKLNDYSGKIIYPLCHDPSPPTPWKMAHTYSTNDLILMNLTLNLYNQPWKFTRPKWQSQMELVLNKIARRYPGISVISLNFPYSVDINDNHKFIYIWHGFDMLVLIWITVILSKRNKELSFRIFGSTGKRACRNTHSRSLYLQSRIKWQ